MNVTPESILQALQALPGGATIPELMSRMSVPSTQKGTMRRVVKQMISEGRLRRGPHGTVRACGERMDRSKQGERVRREDDQALISGTLSRHPDGYGFVAPLKGGGPDLFIPPD